MTRHKISFQKFLAYIPIGKTRNTHDLQKCANQHSTKRLTCSLALKSFGGLLSGNTVCEDLLCCDPNVPAPQASLWTNEDINIEFEG